MLPGSIHELVRNGSNKLPELQKYLDANPVQIDYKDITGWTALMEACLKNNIVSNLDIIQELIDRGANIDITSPSGFTPLMTACIMKKMNIIWILISNGANLDIKNCDNTAIYMSSLPAIKLLAASGATIDMSYLLDKIIRGVAYGRTHLDIKGIGILQEYSIINWNRKIISDVFL